MKKLLALSGFKISLLITLFFTGTFFWNYISNNSNSFLNLIDKKVIDFIIRSKAVSHFETDIAIADIDTKSVDKYGRWPWGRNVMADLLRELESYYEIRILGYDVVFSEKDPNDETAEKVLRAFQQQAAKSFSKSKDVVDEIRNIRHRVGNEIKNDDRFGAELSRWDNIVLGYFMFTSEDQIAHVTEAEKKSAEKRIENSAIKVILGQNPDSDLPVFSGSAIESNIPILVSSRNLSGFFNAFPDAEDGTIRRMNLIMRYGDHYYPSLDLQMLRLYYGNESIQINVDAGGGIGSINVGPKRIETDYDGSVMINYKGPANTFPHYSVYDIIERKVPKEQLKGKIVLLGATEVGVFDLRTTPVGVDYPGVEVHANFIDNVIKDEYFFRSDSTNGITILLILGVGLLVGIILPRLGALRGLLFVIFIIGIYVAGNLWIMENQRSWTSFTYVLGVIIANWFSIVLYKYFGEEKDKRFIKGAFQQYLSPEVIDRLVKNPDLLKLGGEKKELTAFFSDVQGFSTISEALTPEELVELLNEYLTAMTDIVMRHGGTVDKFEGDAIIAFFGAPISYEDHALRACLTALDMQEKMVAMRAEWKAQGRHELYMRIGLNTGEMVVGNMGSAYRMDYTMMGDAVNLAARLEGVNKQYKTYTMISEFTYQQVKEKIEVRELDMIRVVGKNEPVRIYEVLGEKGKVPVETIKAYKFFHKGLQLYRKQDWEESRKYFAACNRMIGGDGTSQIFFDRTKEFQRHPPGERWDGVYQMTSK